MEIKESSRARRRPQSKDLGVDITGLPSQRWLRAVQLQKVARVEEQVHHARYVVGVMHQRASKVGRDTTGPYGHFTISSCVKTVGSFIFIYSFWCMFFYGCIVQYYARCCKVNGSGCVKSCFYDASHRIRLSAAPELPPSFSVIWMSLQCCIYVFGCMYRLQGKCQI